MPADPEVQPSGSGTRIQSVARACRLLLLAADSPQGFTATVAGQNLDLTLPTAHHLLNTLVSEGLLGKDAQRRYYLGPGVGALTDALQRAMAAPDDLVAPMHRLAYRTGEAAYLVGWRNGEICILASATGRRAGPGPRLHVGLSDKAYLRASGMVLLAFASPEIRARYFDEHPVEADSFGAYTPQVLSRELERVRSRGYAVSQGRYIKGTCCVSVPILATHGVDTCYTVVAPSSRFDDAAPTLTSEALACARSAVSIRR